GAAASVTPAKQKRIIKTASHYLCQLDTEPDCRFDVISVQGELRSPAINWIKNAFYS
ncbi:MAG: YraN family protein, partial [gamma proteobacterium symbiont of Bathyaustriella thionipta]|nr:YraN family protein [gamma proteobacterium symbiont of Bathyaustriella thionipta]